MKKEGGQSRGFQPLPFAGTQRQTAQTTAQRLCKGRIGVPFHIGPLRLQTVQNSLGVQSKMTGAHTALIEKFDGVLKLQFRMAPDMLFQQRGQWVHMITPEG